MLRRLYDRTLRLAEHKHATAALFAVSFIESSVFPIPPDVLLIPMIMARRDKALWLAAVCTVASVLGGLLGYAIGHFLFEAVGRSIIAFYGAEKSFEQFRSLYEEWGWWIVAMAGFTPFPYKVITIASGVFGLDLMTFVVASTASRGARFFIEAGLLWWAGPPIQRFVEKNLGLAAGVFFALLFGGFVFVKWILAG
jgi:membrane protein YqaA with SNARE-associated domain